ncbi:tRNA (adenosine(37)-N6)-threonylcarbamoyltransferase complex dimerization subunit type 1 TsaB [Sutterella sp.]|uniref:tRNA (adenosine(37)-N6)-threonylcarbamoyltransferase complex dimerization subunit type 1 TsaB n=1 Tax=Sutterella sp. TaxID=1981025 RepID=UPI0026E050CB|nr:tRNA (adenosine(37)-N6)-threonylcarbamoyltransferase complex dimerization subunit type 1 TsaB [Sutterella sp.]MDO5533012.1 tRNA (adenosine(37)-N6)-threonylcarbamoyltransferase complex dimerization subunit type 1 TsaB [Sutterella sp.]
MTDASLPLILAIDTAQEDCAAALLRGPELIAERVERVGSRHSELILTMIRDLLAEAGVAKTDLGLIAFGAGPGSFTGLRVACGVAQGLAWALELPVAPVSNLESQAEWVRAEQGLREGEVIAVLNDARMHECYGGLWRVPASVEGAPYTRLEHLAGPELVAPAAAAEYVAREGARTLVGSAALVYGDEMAISADINNVAAARSQPAAIGRIAWAQLQAGETVTPELAAPVYVRNRVALTMAERAAGERL